MVGPDTLCTTHTVDCIVCFSTDSLLINEVKEILLDYHVFNKQMHMIFLCHESICFIMMWNFSIDIYFFY